MIALMLHKLGIDAQTTGRNDIVINGRKVSGNAFYHIPGRSIVHGTMLYDTCMENMVGSITPNDEKLLSKGVKSVRQHIALLKDYTSLSIDEFKLFVRQNLCDGEICLTADDVAAVERIMQEYLTDDFIYGNNPRYTLIRKRRFEGAGDFEVRMQLKNNVIRDVDLKGDYFLVGDLDRDLLCHLHGVTLDEPSLRAVLSTLSLPSVIHNMDAEMFLRLLLDK